MTCNRLMVVLAAGFVCSASVARAESLEATLFGREKALCQSVAAKDEKTFNTLVAPDAVIAEDGRVASARNQGFEFHVKSVDIKNFELSDPKVVKVTDDVAILSFKSHTSATRGDKSLPPAHFVSTTWVKRDGNWVAVYSTSYPIEY